MLKIIRKHGYENDPVWSKLDKAAWKRLPESVRQHVRSRYMRTCGGCGKKDWTYPGTLPVCPKCWHKTPFDGRMWWWLSKRDAKAFLKFLDAYFDGGYDVPDDPKQRAGWRGIG